MAMARWSGSMGRSTKASMKWTPSTEKGRLFGPMAEYIEDSGEMVSKMEMLS